MCAGLDYLHIGLSDLVWINKFLSLIERQLLSFAQGGGINILSKSVRCWCRSKRRVPQVFEWHDLSDLSAVVNVLKLAKNQNVLDQLLVEPGQQGHGLTGGEVEIHGAVVAVNGEQPPD